jgi:hypothetical protein
VPLSDRLQHRDDVAAFSDMVTGDEVSFHACSHSELLAGWAAQPNQLVSAHAAAVVKRFEAMTSPMEAPVTSSATE